MLKLSLIIGLLNNLVLTINIIVVQNNKDINKNDYSINKIIKK